MNEPRPKPADRTLHVLNGDATRWKLERSSVSGTLAVWADALYEGPVPPLSVGDEAWRITRAQHAANAGWTSFDHALATLESWDGALERHAEYDEIVVWCEHDLFDQLALIRHLAWLTRRQVGRTRLTLICIGEFPGRANFRGLGELSPGELASLMTDRVPVSLEQLALGHRAFGAVASPDPRALEALVFSGTTMSLPFLAPALRRLLAEYPSKTNGLSRTDHHALSILAAHGRMSVGDLLRAKHAHENAYYITDVSMRALVRRLSDGEPLLSVTPAQDGREWDALVEITPLGRDVLAGRTDFIRLRGGIDRWIGGVHLDGEEPAWRWNPESGRLDGP